MTATKDRTFEVKRERINKSSVKFTARGCNDSVAAPCLSVTLPNATLATLDAAEPDALYVTIHTDDRAAETAVLADVAKEMRERLGVDDLSQVPLMFHETVREFGYPDAEGHDKVLGVA